MSQKSAGRTIVIVIPLLSGLDINIRQNLISFKTVLFAVGMNFLGSAMQNETVDNNGLRFIS